MNLAPDTALSASPAAAGMRQSGARTQIDHQGRPDVSIIIAAFDVAPYIEAALTSALVQSGVVCEVVVADDASRDSTAHLVRRMARADARITLVELEQRGGPAHARNVAIRAARGQWIAVLDGDDVIDPERTAALIRLAVTCDADIAADNFQRVTNDGLPTPSTMFKARGAAHCVMIDAATFMRGNVALARPTMPLGAIKPVVRTAFLRAHAIAYREAIAIGEDYHFILDCLLRGARMVVTSQSFYRYRMRPGSQSWRLEEKHVDALISAYGADAELARQIVADADLKNAAEVYLGSLRRARRLATLISHLKSGRTSDAAKGVLMWPDLWPLLVRFGSEGLGKRLARS